MLNISEATQRIKSVGQSRTRVVPMEGQSIVDGMHQIEIREGDNWSVVLNNCPKDACENIVKQAVNRVILG